MSICPIDVGAAFDCANLKPGGLEPFMMLYNFEDWKAALVTQTAANEPITDITNAVGLQAYKVEFANNSAILPSNELRTVDGGIDGFDHTVDARLFDISQTSRINIAKIRFQKVVAIFMRLDGTGMVFGGDVGMRLSGWTDNPSDVNGNTLQFIMKTPDNDSPEIYPYTSIDAGDAVTTKALIESLETPGV